MSKRKTEPDIKDSIRWLHEEIEKLILRQERMDKQLDLISSQIADLRSRTKTEKSDYYDP